MDCNCEHNNMPQSELRLVRGNDFTTLYQLTAKYADGTYVEDFDIRECTEAKVIARRNNKGSISSKDISAYGTYTLSTNNTLRIDWDGPLMKIGTYTVDFAAKYNGVDVRCYSTTELVFDIVETNEEANIPAGAFIEDGTYMIDGDFLLLFGVQKQADWEQTDPNERDYIKNKPDLNDYVEKVEGYGLSENDYSDEEKQKVEDAVPNTREINGKALDSDITLTSSDIGALPTSTKYGYSIDLSLNRQDFKLTATLKDQDGTALNSKMVDLPLETVVVSGRYDSTNKVIVLTLQNGNPIDIPVGDLVRGLQSEITSSNKLSSDLVDDTNSTNKFVLASEKTAWDGKQDELVSGTNIKTINNQSLLGSGNITIQGGGGGGAIDSISVNGTPQPTDEENNVDITVPTKVSDLPNDSGYITGYTETDPVFSASPAHGITSSDISSWNGKYTKPSSGIPSTDLASGVIPDVSQFITKSVNDLANYYTKSQTYTQTEVQQLINAVKQFTYELVNTLPTASSSTMNKIYLVPSSDPQTQNVNDEYITIQSGSTYSWEQIGSTAIDLSGYVTTTALNNALADYTTTADLNTLLAGYQTKIDSTHKLDYSLLSNTPDIPPVVDALNSGSTTSALSANQGKVLDESKQNVIDATHKLSADLVDDTSTTNKFVTSSEKTTWNGKADKVLVNNHGTDDTTYTLPPNQLHIWGEVASLALTLATPADATIVNEYMIQFESGATATTLSLPSSVEWAESCGALSVEANKTYQISIVNNIGLWAAISNS